MASEKKEKKSILKNIFSKAGTIPEEEQGGIITPDKPVYRCVGNLEYIHKVMVTDTARNFLKQLVYKDAYSAVELMNSNKNDVDAATYGFGLLPKERQEFIRNSMRLLAGVILGDEKVIQEECEKADKNKSE